MDSLSSGTYGQIWREDHFLVIRIACECENTIRMVLEVVRSAFRLSQFENVLNQCQSVFMGNS